MAEEVSSPATSSTLCLRCANIDFSNKLATAWNITYPDQVAVKLGHHSEIIKNPACPCCKLLNLLVARHIHQIERENRPATMPDILDQTFYLRPFEFSPNDQNASASTLSKSPCFNIVEEHILRQHRWYYISRSLSLWANLGYLIPMSLEEPNLILYSEQPEPLADLGLVRSWLADCQQSHFPCSRRNSHVISNFRLIDCQKLEVVEASSNMVYVALSYVWGTRADDPVSNTLYTLPTQIPATIRDAIHVTKELGYSYLWVDRYCIPQDDSEERLSQISLMGIIYANAHLTIIAATSNASTYGIPGVGRFREPLESMSVGNASYVLTATHSWHQIQVSKWNSRGWTYQEAVFSRRRLVFLAREVYFECAEVRCNDGLHHTLNFELMESTPHGSTGGFGEGPFLPVEQGLYPMDEFFTHLSRYTARQLTFPGDTLNGMMGIIAAFEQNYSSFIHLEGVPIVPDSTYVSYKGPLWRSTREEQFLTGLYWKSTIPSKRKPEFPGWSWTGWYGAIQKRNPWHGFVHNVYDVRLLIELPSGDIKDLSSLESSFYGGYNERDLAKRTRPMIWAAIVPVSLQYLERRPKPRSAADPESTRWNAFIHVGDITIPCEKFYRCLEMIETAEDCAAMSVQHLDGVVMGVRRGVYEAGLERGPTRRTLMGDQNKYLAVMVVRRLRHGLRERVGLFEIPWNQGSKSRPNYAKKLLARSKVVQRLIRLV